MDAQHTPGPWVTADAIALCKSVEAICPAYGCHVALTGGLLYKDGPRKDCDLLFYRIRQSAEIDRDGLFLALDDIGLSLTGGFGWCHKAAWQGKPLDLFFPDEEGGWYGEDPLIAAAPELLAALKASEATLANLARDISECRPFHPDAVENIGRARASALQTIAKAEGGQP